MDKLSKIMFILWMVLAVIAFVSSFWAAGLVKIIGLVFGGFNLLIILSWITAAIQGLVQAKRIKESEEK